MVYAAFSKIAYFGSNPDIRTNLKIINIMTTKLTKKEIKNTYKECNKILQEEIDKDVLAAIKLSIERGK